MASLVPTHLRCEYLVDPLAIDAPDPRLSWENASGVRGARQTAYQIVAASSVPALADDVGDLWDTGKVESDAVGQIAWSGKPLEPFESVYWKVRTWDENDAVGSWSDTAHFRMGITDQSLWAGERIMFKYGSVPNPAYFRKEFTVGDGLVAATLYGTADGVFDAFVNGTPAHTDVLSPGWTDYKIRTHYKAWDVTGLLKPGENCLGAIVAEGWYAGMLGFRAVGELYGNRPNLLANLRLEYADGRVETVATDGTWTTSRGAILYSSLLHGERYDARLERDGWARPGFDDSEWYEAPTKEIGEKPRLEAYPCEPTRRTEELKVKEHWEAPDGSHIYDFGQNFAGRVRLWLKGRAGDIVRLRHGEMVDPDGTLYTENLRRAQCTDFYVLKGDPEGELYEPRFTFHGFRYVELTGLEFVPKPKDVTGVVLGTDTQRSGFFECSSPMVNQLYSNLVWTQRANFLEIPTDCPQRDERLGWTGDAQMYCRTAICNMDVAAFFHKWMVDLIDTQQENGSVANVAPNASFELIASAAWADAMTIIPWHVYRCYGDKRILAKHYDAILKFVEYYRATADESGLLRTSKSSGHCFGDWLAVNQETPKDAIITAFYAYSAQLLSDIADTLEKADDAATYGDLASNIRRAFTERFVAPDGTVEGNTQTGYVLALHFDLVPTEMRAKLTAKLVENIRALDNHLATGFVGLPYLMHVLTREGHLDLAYTLLNNDTYPSWGYSIKHGATTIWERWNGWHETEGCGDPGMNSFSHYAYGSVGEWLFNTVAGIDVVEPGFTKVRIAPRPGGGLRNAGAVYRTPFGKVLSEWTLEEDVFSLKVVVPPGTTAAVTIPASSLDDVREGGKPINEVADVATGDAADSVAGVTVEVGSGTFEFTARYAG